MYEKIKVSIICLSYNHKKYIKKALEGFLKQKVNFKYEILINDDLSLDGTQEILKEYEQKYPEKIKVIYQKENQYSKGISPTKFLYEIAQGEYLAFCEGDDYWIDENKLQKQVEFLEKNKDFVGTSHNVVIVDENDCIREEYQKYYPLYKEHKIEKGALKPGELMGQTATIVCRNFIPLFKEKNLFLENYMANGDIKINAILTNLGKIYFFEEKMSCYRRSYIGDSWNARNKNKNLYMYHYNSVLEIRRMLKELFNIDINISKRLFDILFSAIILSFKKPCRENIEVSKKLFLKNKDKIRFLYYFIKKIIKFILKKIGIKEKEKRPKLM